MDFEKKLAGSEGEMIRFSQSDMLMMPHFPDENPTDSISDITNTMNYLGLFEGV
jgi:hypothetical protein